MTFWRKLKLAEYRHAFSAGMAVLLAAVIVFYFNKTGWVILSAFLVSQASRGTPLRQGFVILIAMLATAMLTTLVYFYTIPGAAIIAAVMLFILSSYFAFINQPLQNKTFFRIMLFGLLFLLMAFALFNVAAPLRDQLLDMVSGAVIGIVCGLIFFPPRFVNEFQEDILPVLQSVMIFSQSLAGYFARQKNDINVLAKQKVDVERSLQSQYGIYPEWVYEAGFNPGLRAGFRFYLVNIERLIEICFSMEFYALKGISDDLVEKVADPINIVAKNNKELIQILIEYFTNKKLLHVADDLTSDMVNLENVVKKIIPRHLELLDVSPDYLTLSTFVRDMKDMRKLLLQLVTALPATEK